ncbi:MAG: four helix bundle protein [Chthoniobacterales bacterium]|nr:four helix bundle protein [Chthoniobacterales bacterium]
MFNLEKLVAWQRAIDLAGLIYSETKSFPDSERFGLTSQMRRASVSVSSNVAEGSSRTSKIDFARFVEIAGGSNFELVSQAVIAKRQRFLSEVEFTATYAACEEESRILSGLRTSPRSGTPLISLNSQLSTLNFPA